MIPKILSWLLSTFLLTTASLAEAQQPKKMPRIGYLSLRSSPADTAAEFKQGLHGLGWIEGQNFTIE
jgi:putative ABC transport system substrate-binding protein